MNITIKDIKEYIEELKIQKNAIKEFESVSLFNKEPLIIEWFDKQITKFETKLEEIKNGI